MQHLTRLDNLGITTLTLARGKVNALNEEMVNELSRAVEDLKSDSSVKGVVLTGAGKFFSFGFDVPALYDYSPPQFTTFIRKFCTLQRELFLFPKPLVAAINGHATAGGCILALTTDYRVMTTAKATIGLNEVTFGASIFSSTIDLLKHVVGHRNAERVLLTGELFNPEVALSLGLVDQLASPEEVLPLAQANCRSRTSNPPRAETELKMLLRKEAADRWQNELESSLANFIKIWYSPETRELTKKIVIR